MTVTKAMVVAEPSGVTEELDRALRAGGFTVRHLAPDDVTAPHLDPAGRPDLLLVSASLGLQRLALLARRMTTGGRAPTTVVFPEGGDLAALEACVQGGFDWVTPPFLPTLLRSRVTTCWQRGQLTMAVEDMAAAASLREYERELNIAHDIQAGFLPEALPVPSGWDIATEFRPARQVGGDFYDVFELVDGLRLGFVVADVCDKGVGAALFMALIRTLLRHTAEHTGAWSMFDGDPEPPVRGESTGGLSLPPRLSVGAGPLVQAVDGTNRYMARNHLRQGYFATLFFGVLDPASGALLYINGGHNPPVLVRAEGGHALLNPTGPAVGMLSDSTFSLGHVTLQPGDTLFVYTDGVVEARNPDGALFGMERTLGIVREPDRDAADLVGAVDAAVRWYAGTAEQSDDITMLALRRAAS
jgi:phosphoserine phosphatase RsbU/P